MDFVNRNFSGAFKILIAILAMFVFIKTLPVIVVGGFMVWAGFKGVKYFKTLGKKKAARCENNNVNASIKYEEDPFDFTNKNIVDVEYEEIKK